MQKEKSILSIQYLRGLAALGVVLCHYGSDLKSYPVLSKIFNFGQAGVHVFFLISGFIIVYSLTKANYKPNKFLSFLLKRSVRIDPAYYITIILTILLFKILNFVPGFKGESIIIIPGQFLAHIFYLVPFTKYPFYMHIFWTLCVEFQFYLFIGLLYFLSDNIIYRKIFLVFFSLTCLIPFANSYYVLLNYSPIFALGIALNDYYKSPKWQHTLLPLLFLTCIAYKFGIAIFILLALTAIIILAVKVIIKPLAFLGTVSYSLYLTHPLTFIVVSGILKKANFISQNQLLSLSVKVFIAVFVSYIFYMLIEKPSLRLSKQIFYRKLSRKKRIDNYLDNHEA